MVGRPSRKTSLETHALVSAALAEMERTGVSGFSLRAAARAIGCDPAALIYRFGSREGLERAVAGRLNEEIDRLDPELPWRERILVMARQYRTVAQTYPRTFPVLMRFWTTGPRDLLLTEDCYSAFNDAGIPADQLPAIECGFYAALLGLCAAEAGGLLGQPAATTLSDITADPRFNALNRYLPQIGVLTANDIFEKTLSIMLDGIDACRDDRQRPKAQSRS